jgi:hypothetical protein
VLAISKHALAQFGTVEKIRADNRLYEKEKAAWAAAYPEASPQEYEQAMREISKRLCF